MLGHSQNYQGERSGISEPEMLLALARIAQPDLRDPLHSEEKTLKDNTRDFKACLNWGGGFFRFDDSSVRNSFNERVQRHYSDVLVQMFRFVDMFLDAGTSTRKDEYLVKAILEVIDDDGSIPAHQLFYCCHDGKPMTKEEILNANVICLQPFLLGIWHFVITGVDDNTIGADTYNEWCPSNGGGRRRYKAALGEHSNRNVRIEYCVEEILSTQPDEVEEEIIEDPVQVSDVHSDVLHTEVGVQQPVSNPFTFVFNQYGNNGTQIAHVENYYGGKKQEG